MFVNEKLQEYLETSSSVRGNSFVLAEWNMNIAENIALVGNYRYRPLDSESFYSSISQSFSFDDRLNRFYTGATDSDTLIDGGVSDNDEPIAFIAPEKKEALLYSLEDCFGRFRPRSGINKLRYFENRYTHFSHPELASRPRYYMSSRRDTFKYWTSYRKEIVSDILVERGIANVEVGNAFGITDTAPFVVYEEQVPANRVVVKMQTNVGTVNLGPFIFDDTQAADPFFGVENQTTPVRWKIQYLDSSNSWVDAVAFDENSRREDESPIIGPDGYVEIFYGLLVPSAYKQNFDLVQTFPRSDLLPDPTFLPNGTAYRVANIDAAEKANLPSNLGTIYVVRNQESQNQGTYVEFAESYGWDIYEGEPLTENLVTKLANPSQYTTLTDREALYREFQYIKGLRVVVDTMNVFNSTFDLIELSPRLIADVSDYVTNFSVTRSASDLGTTGLPVGQLLASIGNIEIFDNDQAFFDQNPNSIIANHLTQNIQFKFYEKIKDNGGNNYYVPLKTLYSETFPTVSNKERVVSLELRDLYFYFESLTAPQILIRNVSLSYAISMLLDSIGFTNYVFFRTENETETIIPFFFIPPETSVAEILLDLAISTQSAMFFDEYNNFVVMSKNYLMPNESQRSTNITLYGSNDFSQNNQLKNQATKTKLSNIMDLSFKNNTIFNDGIINYTTRSIQRTYASLRQVSLINRSKNWIYKPALLWEVTGSENVRSINEETSNQSAYTLSAVPLNSDLSNSVPSVRNNRLINNTMDFGDGAYWTSRYNGYFFANGEVIKYDAIQYSIPGLSVIEQDDPNVEGDNVWISSVEEYQKYFAKIPFNGKMYPTGLVRIYAEPNYEVVNGSTQMVNGSVAKHGRGQFGTTITNHPAGVSNEWLDSNRLIGCNMDSRFIFNEEITQLTLSDVILENNETQAVFKVADTSLINLGTYMKFAPEIESDDFNNFLDLDDNEIIGIDATNNLVTINSNIKFLNEEYFERFESEREVTFTVSLDTTTIVIDEPIADLDIEVGMYVKVRDAENVYLSCKVTEVNEVDAENTQIVMSGSPINSEGYVGIQPISDSQEDAGEDPVKPGDEITRDLEFGKIVFPNMQVYEKLPSKVLGKAGIDTVVTSTTTRTDLIKNTLVSPFLEENSAQIDNPATMQSSALVLKGNITNTVENPRDFIATVYKPFNEKFNHFGTRMRVVGKLENNDSRGQTPEGSEAYFNSSSTLTGQSSTIYGGSGGLAVLLNPATNNGYYFEISALTESNLVDYSTDGSIYNVMFYRIDRSEDAQADTDKAIPTTLFGGIAEINVDSGDFAGQGRLANDQITTVYDISVEYEDIEDFRRFYLYLNNENIAIVDDPNPLPAYNNTGLFVRGNAKIMYENIFALVGNYSQNTGFELKTPVSTVFDVPEAHAQNSFQKYAMSGLVQSTYLSGINSLEPPRFNIYFDEFGTIMREAAYFNIRYDKAYPALVAQLSPTFTRVKGYTASGFVAGAYGAEFLIFNHTDTALTLDSASGNYLRIQGVTFTQQSTHELTVDEYFDKNSNLSDPIFVTDTTVKSPVEAKKKFNDIVLSRLSQGRREFNIQSSYIQTQDAANEMMDWLVKKVMRPRKSVGLKIFPMPTLQLGDIVTIDYTGGNGFEEVANKNTRFVVYHIIYSKAVEGPSMEVYLSEVS